MRRSFDVDRETLRRAAAHVERAHERAIRVDERVDGRAVVEEREMMAVVTRSDARRGTAATHERGDRCGKRSGRHAHHRSAAFSAARRLA